jgi:hypothetical protein
MKDSDKWHIELIKQGFLHGPGLSHEAFIINGKRRKVITYYWRKEPKIKLR